MMGNKIINKSDKKSMLARMDIMGKFATGIIIAMTLSFTIAAMIILGQQSSAFDKMLSVSVSYKEDPPWFP